MARHGDIAFVRIDRALEREADIAAVLAASLITQIGISTAEDAVEIWCQVRELLAAHRDAQPI